MSRYGLLGMTLVVTAFVLVLLLLAPKTKQFDTSRRLSHLGMVLDVYCYKTGHMPPVLSTLADDGMLSRDQLQALEREVRFVAGGAQRDGLSGRAVVALQDPTNVAGSILVVVLLADGSVLPVPADAVRDAVARAGQLVVLEAASDGQLRAVAVGSPGVE